MKKTATIFCLLLAICSVSQVPSYVPSNGLLAWYPFSGNANDATGNGHNGTVAGAALSFDRFNVASGSYHFNGSTDYISIPDNSLNFRPQNFTISSWVKFEASSGSNYKLILSKNVNISTYESIALWYDTNFNAWFADIGSTTGTSLGLSWSSIPALNTWYHYVFQYNAATGAQIIYVNGTLVNSVTTTAPLGYNNQPWTIGMQYNNNLASLYFTGNIDDIGIWDRLLTQCEIQQLYTASISTISASSATICAGQSTTLTASGGTGSYTWTPGGQVSPTLAVSPTINSTFSVSSTLGTGCTAIGIYTVQVNSASITVSSGSICSGSSYTISASGASTYTYSGGNAIVNPPSSTNYTVTGTTSAGCYASAISSVQIIQVPTISVNSGSMCSGTFFTIIPSGASSYTYSGGGAVVTPTANSTYTITGATGGCIGAPVISSVQVIPGAAIAVNSGSICSGDAFVFSPSGAISSYTYSGGSPVVSPTVTSNYTISGANSSGCIGSAISTVQVVRPNLQVNSGVICPGSSFTISPTGASSYTYSGGGSVVSPASSTNYTVIGMGVSGCTAAAVSSVQVSSTTLSANSGSICSGSSFIISPSGAVSSYTYTNGGPLVSPTISTNYTVTGINPNGCLSAGVSSVQVVQTPVISVSSGSVCSGSSFTLYPSGAVNYTYSGGSAIVSPVSTSVYTVSGATSGCTATPATVTVQVITLPPVAVNSGTICSGGSFTLSPSGASGYVFSSGGAVVSPSSTSSYTVTGTNTSGCSSSAVSTVQVINVIISVNSGSVCSGSVFTLAPSGAVAYTYSGGSATVSPASTNNYTITGASSAGCISQPVVSTVQVIALPVISAGSGTVCSGSSFTISPSGALTYTYSGGSAVVNPVNTTTYTVTGTNASGCVGLPVTSIIQVVPRPSLSVNSGSVCSGRSFTLLPTGAATYTYSSGNSVVSPASTSNYTIIGTSSAGCVGLPVISTVQVIALPILSVNSGSLCNGSSFTMAPAGALNYTYSGGSAVVTPSSSSVYTVTGTSASGCTSSVISTVQVIPLPALAATGGSVCGGSVFTINATGATSYTYSGGSQLVTPSITTTYTVMGANGAGCIASVICAVVVVQSQLTASSSSTIICNGTSATLTASGASTYSWTGASSAGAAAVISPSTTTVYTVLATDLSGCSFSTNITQIVDPCTSLAINTKKQIGLRAYPNPTDGIFIVELLDQEPGTLIVSNASGETVHSEDISNLDQKLRIDLTGLANGIYFIRLTYANFVYTARIVKS